MTEQGPVDQSRSNDTARQRFEGTNRRTVLGAIGAGTGLAALGMLGGSRPVAAHATPGHQSGIPTELPSAIEIDEDALEVTLPLFRGRGPDDEVVYYVLTESSDIGKANQFGLNWAAKLKHVIGTDAVQQVSTGSSGEFNPNNPNNEFEGTVDFSLTRNVVPNPDTGFPPDEADPGAEGDGTYSPFITTSDEEVVYNAPHVANGTGEHDQLLEMDTDEMTVTLRLVQGFYEFREIFYLTTDAYPGLVAALEGGTLVPNLSEAPAVGDRDLESSAREAIFPVVNGPPGQGLQSALQGNGGPHNITRSEQVCADPSDPTDCSLFYSPLWDLHPLQWEVDEADRTILEDHEEIIDLVLDGDISSFAEEGPINTLLGNIRALGAAVNCPVISVEEEEE
ncbi:DUF7482 domain-containing protein [Haloarchaeobius sp. HRN-SO-5]|uniref:DUF7482 domain-containing protein n=1 Tax=Haloarchaeobius sp. HRN-SO-5 TaxID=3446118 RepID=UPI003EB7264C